MGSPDTEGVEARMRQVFAVALSMLIGFMFGALGTGSLQAHRTGGAYAVIEVDDIIDQAGFAAAYPKLLAVSEAFGGRTIIEADRITGRDRVPPRRFAVIAFDRMADAEAWSAASAEGEVDQMWDKSARARSFLVDAP
jgi:uncharacterized protein (DUF1330 family)